MEDVAMEVENPDLNSGPAKVAPEKNGANASNGKSSKTEDSDSSMCSSSFSLSDEENEEEKKEFKEGRANLIKKFGLDKLKKHFPQDNKLSARVKYYSFDIKRKQREELPLRGWHKLRLYKNDKFLDDWINEPDEISTMNVERVDANDISVEEFMERYETPGVPCILLNCAEHWDAMSKWNFPDLIKKFKKCKLKVGEDDEGYPLKMKLKYFIEYLIYNKDDSPLYLFQSSIESRKKIKEIVKDYTVPKFFQDDYFKILGTDTRPPYRWLLVGPRRSGTTIHCDPLSTSAWNTSIQGHKKWVLFPPTYSKEFVKGKKYKEKGGDDEAVHYMKYIYPKILENDNVEKRFEFIQRPGETVFVPGKWWRCVLNLDDTIAITQNYVNRGNFERVWKDARKNRKKMAVRWVRKMKCVDKPLYRRALDINKNDGFLMYDIARMKKISWPYSESSSSSSSSTSLSDYDFEYSDIDMDKIEYKKEDIEEKEVKLEED